MSRMEPTTALKAGEVWKVNHSRKGPLTLRILEDVDLTQDDPWVEAEIVDGTVRWLSAQNRVDQRLNGLGTAGDTLTVRANLMTLVEKVGSHGTGEKA